MSIQSQCTQTQGRMQMCKTLNFQNHQFIMKTKKDHTKIKHNKDILVLTRNERNEKEKI